MIDHSTVLPIAAALIHLVGFLTYNIQAKLRKSDPNPVTWLLWAFLALQNALSFSEMNDRVAALQFFAGSVGCMMTFAYTFFIGRLDWPKGNEWGILVAGIVALTLRKEFSATTANMTLAAVLACSFWLTIRGVWENPMREKPPAWWLWTIAYLLTGVHIYQSKGLLTPSMVMPLLGLMGHGVVAILCKRSRRQNFLLWR